MLETHPNFPKNLNGIDMPEEMMQDGAMLARLSEEVAMVVPSSVFSNHFHDGYGVVERGGFPWKVIPAQTKQGYELIPPKEYYRIDFRQISEVYVPEYASVQGGQVGVRFQWDITGNKPSLRLFDISCAGTAANKTRFIRAKDDPQYFKPSQFGVNLQNTSVFKPLKAPALLPHPRIVYDFNESDLQTQKSANPEDKLSGKYYVGSGGQQIIFPGPSTNNSVSSMTFNVEVSSIEYTINSIFDDNTIGIHLRIPLVVEDFRNPHIDIRSVDRFIGNIASIILPK
ncbi:MAG TPA: hypothetical protein PK863_02140 [Candidatus Dojkabacteria bacterium]|nr:hypothetical protein [Candidatus Dojkabacteria bacterium]HRP37592.1 hypothetical protein [Candidatus Dojkabacteria bacterium]HRP50740.1 hypothetical protein [Candidatus Dojkabacteria bacterium]